MKKLPFLITIGVTLLLVGGYYLYEKLLLKKPIQSWDIVPNDAILVYEKDDCSQCLNEITQSSAWKAIRNFIFESQQTDTLNTYLQKVMGQQSNLLVSVHTTKKDDFDLVYYTQGSQEKLQALDWLKKTKGYRYSTREFNAVKIYEISFSKQVFSWTLMENIWVGSFTPFLIEDVIRTFKSKKGGFKNSLLEYRQVPPVQGDGGNLYISIENFYRLLTALSPQIPPITSSFGKFSSLDVKSDDQTISLNGFSVDSANQSNYLLSLFRHQSPVPFELKNTVSNRTVMLTSFGISDGGSFQKDLNVFFQKYRRGQADTLQQLSSSLNIDLSTLYKSIRDEVGVCFLESSKGNDFSKVMIIKTDAPQKWLSAFEKIAQKLSVDTLFHEYYSDYEIREVPVYNFPEKLFWPLVSGFNQSFYSSVGNTILVAENLDELKRFLTDIDNEETWNKSVSHNKFLKTTLLESNLNLYINTPRIWRLLSPNLHPRWRQIVKDNQTALRSLQYGAIQFSHLNNSYYTNVSWNYKPVDQKTDDRKNGGQRFITSFGSGIQSLYAVKSHVNRADEVLIQDSLNDLSLLTDEGKVLWKLPVGDGVRSEVHQIDFFKNGKLQYFFATRDALHVIDRLGNYVEPFPVQVAGVDISYASVVDYDNSKKYRFLIADKSGKLWMFDKEGKALEGWMPKDLGEGLVVAPQHHRIKGKDYIIAIRNDGKVHLMNRRGEDLKNFPINLDGKVSGDYVLDAGTSIKDTYFVVVTRDGYRIKFNPEGKIQSRETLLKTAFNTQFRLVAEKSNKSYLIVQQDSKQLNILDESLKKVLTNESIGMNAYRIQYYDFGAGRIYMAITDIDQKLTYIYNEQGDLLTVPPIESSLIEIRPIDADRAALFFSLSNALTIEAL